jgi:hypothetical protein
MRTNFTAIIAIIFTVCSPLSVLAQSCSEPPTCSAGQASSWNGTAWTCVSLTSTGAQGFSSGDLTPWCGHNQYCSLGFNVTTPFQPGAVNCTPETWSDSSWGHNLTCDSYIQSSTPVSGGYLSSIIVYLYAGSGNAFNPTIRVDISLLPGIPAIDHSVSYGGGSGCCPADY